jgi:hypothetical protein
MPRLITSSRKGGLTLLLLLASACSSDGAVQVIPAGGGGETGKGGGGGTPGAAGTPTAGSAGSSSSGSGGLASAGGSAGGAAVSGAAGSGGAAAGGAAGSGGLAGTGTGGEVGGAGSSSGSGGEATAGGAGNGGNSGSGGSGGTPTSACAAMSANAETYEGHCYELVETPTGWRAAEQDCEQRGGYLVTISSEGELTREDFDAEQTFVWNLAKQMDVWIGATDGLMDDQPGNGTHSTWSNGEMMVINDWEGGEPSNTPKTCPSGQGMCHEHCGFMWQERGGGWNDEVCAAEKRYVCEWDAP